MWETIKKMAWGYGCSGYRETRCNFAIGTVAKKKLTDHQIKALLAGESVMVKGMKGKMDHLMPRSDYVMQGK